MSVTKSPLDCLVIGAESAALTAAIHIGRFQRRFRVINGCETRARLIPTSARNWKATAA